MGYKELTRDVAGFGKEVYADIQAFKATQKENNKLVGSGEMGAKQSRDILDGMRNKIIEKQARKAELSRQYAQTLYNAEVNKMDSVKQSVTSEMVAELSLLAQLKVEQSDIDDFTEKFNDVPLALRKLKDIAKQNKLDFEEPHSKLDDLKLFDNKIQKQIDIFSDSGHIEDDIMLKFHVTDVDKNMNFDYENYLNSEELHESGEGYLYQ